MGELRRGVSPDFRTSNCCTSPARSTSRRRQRKRAAVGELIQLIQRALWLGHFDLWREQDLVMFRHSLCLAGGASASDGRMFGGGERCGLLLRDLFSGVPVRALGRPEPPAKPSPSPPSRPAARHEGAPACRAGSMSPPARSTTAPLTGAPASPTLVHSPQNRAGVPARLRVRARLPVFPAREDIARARCFWSPTNGRSETQNLALPPRHAPLRRRPQGCWPTSRTRISVNCAARTTST